MNFIVHSYVEYRDTVLMLFDSGMFKETALNNIFEIEEETVLNKPINYPVIVSIEMEEWAADNKCFTFNGLTFLYINDILKGTKYQEYLKELSDLDLEEAALENIINTSGLIDKPINELNTIKDRITVIEKILF